MIFLEWLSKSSLVEEDNVVASCEPLLSSLFGLVLQGEDVSQFELVLVVDFSWQLDCYDT